MSMRGKTGASTQTHLLVSNCKAAVEKRQSELKRVSNAIPIAKFDAIASRLGMSSAQKGKYIHTAQKKEQSLNDQQRAGMEFEVAYTLVKNGTQPIRVALMTRAKARLWNKENKKMGTGLYWVMGRQKIQ